MPFLNVLKTHARAILTLLLVFGLGHVTAYVWPIAALQPAFQPAQTAPANPPANPIIFVVSPERRQHILYGSTHGGGHKAGQGKPGESEFPPDWDDEKIIAAALSLANDAGVAMRPSGRYWLKNGVREGVLMRVVLDPESGTVITAYPTAAPRNR